MTAAQTAGRGKTRTTRRRLSALLLATAGLAIGGHYVWFVTSEEDRTACRVAWQRSLAEQITARSVFANEADLTVDQFLLGSAREIAKPRPTSPAAVERQSQTFRRLATTYAEDRSRIRAERSARPLPPFPRDC